MSSILKVDQLQDSGGNAIITSDGAGNLTPNFNNAGNLVKIDSQSGTAQSDLADVRIELPETYKAFRLYWRWKPETDNVNLYAKFSTDGGSSYHNSANNYKLASFYIYTSTDNQIDNNYSDGDSILHVSKTVGNNTANGEGNSFIMDIQPIDTESSVKQQNIVHWSGTRMDNSNAIRGMFGVGSLEATYTAKMNYILFYPSSGNIEDYFYTLYGVRT